MSILFADARSTTQQPGRSTAGLSLGVGAHAAAVVLIALTIGAPAPAVPSAPRTRPRMVFLAPVTLPAAPVVTPRLAPPPPPVRRLPGPEPPKPLPVAPVVARTIERVPEPLVPATPPPPERVIERPEPPRPVETGLFERTNTTRTIQTTPAVTTGAFEATTPPRDAATAVAAVTTGGFGNAARAPRATSGEVQTAGFDRRAPARQTAAVASADRPVEIVFKPTPEYTDEARSARIEGTVSLELEFTAAGEVRVLRVVRGLGYGLDEAAQRAAIRIRFKPAQSEVGPIDSRATVHITFRLS